MIVLDASVVVKVLLPEGEPDADHAEGLWRHVRDGRVAVRQPAHWLAEVGAVLARLSPGTVARDVRDLHRMELPVVDGASVYETASRLAVDLDHHLFDTLYHAVALASDGATLVTADERYYRKAQGVGRVIRLAEYDVA